MPEDLLKEKKFKALLTDETLQLIMDINEYLETDLCGVIDPYESARFVDLCYGIAGKEPNWPNQ